MADDLITRMLGGLRSPRRSPGDALLTLATGFVAAAGITALAYVALVDDPLGGEPSVTVALERGSAARPPAGDDDVPIRHTLASEAEDEPLPEGHALPPADIVIGDDGRADMAALTRAPRGLPSTDPELTEISPHGPLPRISDDGRRPADVYARPAAGGGGPRIAILVAGMGLSSTLTETAINRLPGTVSLAFAPYGRESERLTARARQGGHEILLQVPLEPFDYPDNDPGPHTLLTGLETDKNRERLHWVMSRFTGYVGVTNYMGGRFTASADNLRPFLGELRERGLVYVDDGTSPRSVAARVANDVALPFVAGDVVIDAEPTRAAIGEALEALERQALERGHAVGVATGLPAAIEVIAEWALELPARGIELVPVSAAVSGGES